eukprot:scaffold104638_cov69-Phaeocystis_antarctica.AAC.8
MAVDTLLSAAATVCMERARGHHGWPRRSAQGLLTGSRDGAVAPQAYCARPRLASVELRTCQPVNSHPLCRESSRSRSHSLDDQSV